jgi:PiT family inorganic phosphate transporter
MTAAALLFATVFLAYSNGANDNFKGVATLFGSDVTDYRRALWWATITTFAGSVCSIFLADALIVTFSGNGLVPDFVAGSPDFLTAVALGAGCTVILATLSGLPISTTHALIGALVGAGVMAVGAEVDFSILGGSFLLPMLVSPLLAILLGSMVYALFRCLRIASGINKEFCICVDGVMQAVPISQPGSASALACATAPELVLDTIENCTTRYTGRVMGLPVQSLLDAMHYLSAGVVSFARGLNDTPKIVALLVALKAFNIESGMLLVAVAMAAGGLLNARKVGHTMARKITPLSHGQGFTANLVTALLVIFASQFGMPVSTTHVSVGSLFGIGLITRKGNGAMIGRIVLSWLITLPVAALFGGLAYWIAR